MGELLRHIARFHPNRMALRQLFHKICKTADITNGRSIYSHQRKIFLVIQNSLMGTQVMTYAFSGQTIDVTMTGSVLDRAYKLSVISFDQVKTKS